ncbi:hypothetical protein BDY17DRAFT_295153 [Neohortaea acidophila]|uniref:Fungal-specific transcription factor domain-containing protein n=1 Tax=Neohortaea acidophila TaxID=245834 RepID=A0A6A6PVX0_9PEZI|nr:uncharacterized protein BDY17DRAFT_295153 [Neohortaea acidophila]KAF2484182.1 hypothetical protein BDY17DRAFT_295153 [Neohortaea acidophila]
MYFTLLGSHRFHSPPNATSAVPEWSTPAPSEGWVSTCHVSRITLLSGRLQICGWSTANAMPPTQPIFHTPAGEQIRRRALERLSRRQIGPPRSQSTQTSSAQTPASSDSSGMSSHDTMASEYARSSIAMYGAPSDSATLISATPSADDGDEVEFWDDPIRSPPHSADVFRYTLAEMFGASLIGSGAKSTRSTAVDGFRDWLASSSPPGVLAANDSLCLLLPASTLNDPRLLHESRKRHNFAVRTMQIALKTQVYDVESVIACALGLFHLDLFRPLASGVRGLYEGFVHLTHMHWKELRASPSLAAGYIRTQLRQTVLLRSLASRVAMPVPIELWHPWPGTMQLLPEITESLMQLAVKIPGLLADADEVRGPTQPDVDAVGRSLLACLDMERKLLGWQDQYCTEVTLDLETCNFPRSWAEFTIKDKGGVTRRVATSPDKPIVSAYCQAVCYICLLLLREAVAELHASRGEEMLRSYYIELATLTADTLCRLTFYLIEGEDGLLGRATAARAPLHFANQWYEKSSDFQAQGWVMEQELRVQKQMPFLAWEHLLPLSLCSMYLQG